MERISAQLQFTSPVVWDEMLADTLREAVVDIHNIVFGQLGTLAFTMHEIGLSFEEVQGTILELSRGAQLVEDQEHDLLKSIRKTFNMLHTERNPSITDETPQNDTAKLSLASAEGVLLSSISLDPQSAPHLNPMKMSSMPRKSMDEERMSMESYQPHTNILHNPIPDGDIVSPGISEDRSNSIGDTISVAVDYKEEDPDEVQL
jgi:hypothetical protein